MGLFTQQVQQLYVAYFNRPADAAGLNYWESVVEANGGSTTAVSAAFAASAEYTAAYAGLSTAAIVNRVYQNLFGREAEPAGLLYWSLLLDQGAISISNVVTVIAVGAQGSDATAYNNKVAGATLFTDSLDTTEQILAYDGAAANAVARGFITSITDDASFANAVAAGAFQTTLDAVVTAFNSSANTPTTVALTVGIDSIAPTNAQPLKGGDTFNAFSSGSAQTFTSFDSIDGDAGLDTLNIVSATGSAFTAPTTATVKNIERANVTGDNQVTIDTGKWTGLQNLTVAAVGTSSVAAASDTAITVTSTGTSSAAATINGGSTVSFTATGSSGGSISVGGTTAASGAVTVSNTTAGAVAAGSISVTGGTSVTVTQAATNAVNTTSTNGAVTVTGNANTTTVSVTSAAAKTAAAAVAGVNASSVTITDVNAGSTTAAGKITSATVNNFTTLSINDNALTTLSVSGGSGNIIIDNSGLTTPTNRTLGLTINGQTGGTLDDADIYTTLNVTTTGTDSTLANVTFGAATALNVAGTKALTLTSTAGLSALKTVAVTGTAGVTGNFSGATVTGITTTGTTGTTTVTIDGSKATYTGGAGVDAVTLAATTPSKAISLGDGADSLDLSGATGTPTGAIDGGAGTDSLRITATLAATSSASSAFAGIVKNFESLVLTAATNNVIDLAVLGNFSSVSTSGGNGLTLNNMPTGGTLTLTGAGTAYTVANNAFTTPTNDVLNVALTDGTNAGVAFASTGITAANVETINISVDDAQATATGTFNNSLTILGDSARTINVTGDAGLTLTAASTALTSLDASGISKGGFTFTAGALAGNATIKGSATGTNVVTATAATGTVTYTGGTGTDTIVINNGKNNTVALGDGTNSYSAGNGINTVTGGAGADTVALGSGANIVNLGNGTNTIVALGGNNTITTGTGVDLITLGGGVNTISTGTGADAVVFTASAANVNSYSTITDAHAGLKIQVNDFGVETFQTTRVTLQSTAVFQDYANAVIQAGSNASVNGYFGWFQFGGDTYLVQSRHDGSGNNASFVNGTDFIVRLTGLVDLSTATGTGTNVITLG